MGMMSGFGARRIAGAPGGSWRDAMVDARAGSVKPCHAGGVARGGTIAHRIVIVRRIMAQTPHSIFDFEALSIEGKAARLSTQRGKVMLIVNTASACGFTPQFAGLEKLWETYRDRGLVVLGFPSNEFGGQDPGSDGEIASFCQLNYGVSFPMMSKVKVNGADAHPLWKWPTKEAPGILGSKSVKWNFTKFLIGRDGRVLGRYAPTDNPEAIAGDIEAALAAKDPVH
jgi:glutathione peroxidase